jgi:hypothetical protein
MTPHSCMYCFILSFIFFSILYDYYHLIHLVSLLSYISWTVNVFLLRKLLAKTLRLIIIAAACLCICHVVQVALPHLVSDIGPA